MSELFSVAVAPVMLPLTVLLALCLAYWSMLVVGVFDLDTFDPDFEADGIFDFGEAPFMLVLSLLIIFAWFIGVVAVHLTGMRHGLAWLGYLPVFAVSYGLTWLISGPLGRVFAHMSQSHAAVEQIVGQLCTLRYDTGDQAISQAEIKTKGAPVLVNVKARPGKILARHSEVLIVELDECGTFYYVEELDEFGA